MTNLRYVYMSMPFNVLLYILFSYITQVNEDMILPFQQEDAIEPMLVSL